MTSALEIAANLTVAASILLAGRNSVHTWWTGIIGCSLFGLVFYEARLYADVVLQGVFVLTSVIGWWQWLRGDHGHALPITRVQLRTLGWMLPAAVLASIGYGLLLHTWTDAYAPFLDSAVLVLSVVAQLLIPVFMALVGMGAQAASRAHQVELGGMNAFLLDRLRGLATLRALGAVDAVEQSVALVRVPEAFAQFAAQRGE